MAGQPDIRALIKTEYAKCLADPVYFINKYCWIQHPTKGRIRFVLYKYQEDVLRQLISNDKNIILKSRQLGISTLSAAYSLWLAMFFRDKNILVVATKQDVAKNLITKSREMYAYLPTWLKNIVIDDENNKMSMHFKNGSQIKAVSSAGDSGRSEALSLLVIDEAAFIMHIEDLWASVQQTLATGGKAIILSTPNGFGNFFHRMWQKAEEHSNGFNPIKLHWSVHPDRDETWRLAQTAELGEKLAAQECLSGDTIVRIKDITGKEFDISIEELYNISTTGYQILTPNGFQLFESIQKRQKNESIELKFKHYNDIKIIRSSLDHPHIVNNKIKHAKDFKVGDFIDTINGAKPITEINITYEEIELYDIINVAGGNIFYANDIVTHNCDCSFLTSGHTVIASETLQKYSDTMVIDPVETRGHDNELWIWKYPDYTKDYVVVADVSRGDSNDYSAFHVFDVETIEQVAEYRGMIPTQDYGNMLVTVATEYNDALLVIENSNIGWAAIQPAIDREYKNLYYSYKDTQIVDAPVLLSKGYDLKDKSQMVAGFTMSSKSRPMVMSKLERYFREEACIVHSKRLIDELYVFIWLNGRPEAAHGYNDDLVMSFAIGMWVRDTALRLKQEGLQLTKQSINSITRSNMGASGAYNSRRVGNDPWKMKVGGSSMDLKWLIG